MPDSVSNQEVAIKSLISMLPIAQYVRCINCSYNDKKAIFVYAGK